VTVRIRRGVKLFRMVMLISGLACLGIFAASIVYQTIYQDDEIARFEGRNIDTPANPAEKHPAPGMRPSQPRNDAPARGGAVGKIDIQRLHLSAMVEEGVSDGVLFRAVGHVPGTALPGERGNVGIAGHRDSFFRGLKDIERGDTIRFETTRGSYTYVVKELSIVDPSNTKVLAATGDDMLTLVTCYPFRYIGSAPRRFIVHATLISSVSREATKKGTGRSLHSRPGD